MVIEDDVMHALIKGVMDAVPKGGNERSVVTFITIPMWKIWCRASGIPEGAVPTPWEAKPCYRVYGSETVLVCSQKEIAISVGVK